MKTALLRRLASSVVVFVMATALTSIPVVSAHAAPRHDSTGETVAYKLHIVAHDNGVNSFYFNMPGTTSSGLNDITFVNEGTVPHMAQLALLHPGVSETQFLTDLLAVVGPNSTPAQDQKLFGEVTAYGGSDSLVQGRSQEVFEWLPAGHYVVFCLDGEPPHFTMGMHHTLIVKPAEHATSAHPAHVDGTVLQQDMNKQTGSFGFVLPKEVLAQHRTLVIAVKNTSEDETHEFQIFRLPTGTTRAQLGACILPPGTNCTIPFEAFQDFGGDGGHGPGITSWVVLHLEPGTYGVICFLPDLNTGIPHAFMGMYDVFNVNR
ncbi:MAG TPA: hypothetical protein VF120_03190 [Ktedonobacterales bacterium]